TSSAQLPRRPAPGPAGSLAQAADGMDPYTREIADQPVIDQLLRRSEDRVEKEVLVYLEHDSVSPARIDHGIAFPEIDRHRFLHADALHPRLGAADGLCAVEVVGREDLDDVERLAVEHLFI